MLKERKCIYCGKVFNTPDKRKKVCHNCRVEKSKNEKPKAVKKSKPLSIPECISIIEKYNREHGTWYTYGNFPHKELFYKRKGGI